MQLNELKLLSNLIHSYGVDEINRIIDSNVEFLNYLKQSEKNILYNENNNITIKMHDGIVDAKVLEVKEK